MALLEINRDPSAKQVRQFACYWLPGFCLVLATMAVVRDGSWIVAGLLTAIAAASLVLAAVRPRWMRTVFVGWMLAASPIGWIVSHALMAFVYFVVIMPIGLILRSLGRDPLARTFDTAAESYWKPRTADCDPARYFRQF